MAPPKKLGPTRTKRKLPKMGPPFKCPECKKKLSDNSAYHQHMQLHAEDRPFACEQCSYTCKIKKYLSRHVKKVHGPGPNGPECPVCQKVFHFDCNLKAHMVVHTGEKPHKCQVCGKAFSSRYCLSMHKLIHTQEKPFECKFCDYACRDSSTLRRHQERHMGIVQKYPCKLCNKVFLAGRTRKIHIDEVHYGLDTRKYHCTKDKCDKAFKTKSALTIHLKVVHDPSTRVPCDVCGRTIGKHNLTSHLKTHVDIRPYKCSYAKCNKRFKDTSTLKKHVMIHYPEYQYRCDMCDARFPRKTRLREHKLRHTTQGGYTCDYCGVSFVKKSFITNHIRLKHGKKGERGEKYICDECGLVNHSRYSIVLHLKYGHGFEHDRKCAICPVRVQNSSLLVEHYFIRHKIKFVARKSLPGIEVQNATSNHQLVLKAEPVELSAEFDFNYEVQKVELDDDHVPDHETQTHEYTNTAPSPPTPVVEDVLSNHATLNIDGATENEFDRFFTEQVLQPAASKEQNTHSDIPDPEFSDMDTTYSESVLKEDISRSLLEREKKDAPDHSFDEFVQQALSQPKQKELPKNTHKVDKRGLKTVNETVKKMLNETRQRKEVENLEKFRQTYNLRIQTWHKSLTTKKEPPKKITYFKKSDKVQESDNSHNDNIPNINDKISVYNDDVTNDSQKQQHGVIENDKESDIDEMDTNEIRNHNIDTLENELDNVELQGNKTNEGFQQDSLENDNIISDTLQNDIPNVDTLQNHNLCDEISNNNELVNNLLESDNVVDMIQDDKPDNIHESDKIDGQKSLNNDVILEIFLPQIDKLDEIPESDRNENDDIHDNNITSENVENVLQLNNEPNAPSENEIYDKSLENDITYENTETIAHQNDTLDEVSDIDKNDNDNSLENDNDKSLEHDITTENTEKAPQNDKSKSDDSKYDIPIAYLLNRARKSKRKNRKVIRFDKDDDDKNDSDYVCDDNTNKNGKMTFDGHECYICFKLFKTKEDLKTHCSEHFEVCNEIMLKKCPFCGYVTKFSIKRHIELVHKINFKYAYGTILEKHNSQGSKFVCESNNEKQIEVIPSVSNLNKRACMKNEEKIRKNNITFIGTKKLVRKGDQWVIEKEAANLTEDFLLPEFSDEEYRNIKIQGDSYLDRMKKLSFLAKKRGVKMLYPCQGCEKVCQNMSALTLHNRKHEKNPKQFKPKIWVNRNIEYKTKMRKNKKFKKPVPPVKDIEKPKIPSANRFQSPKPVKNKHKCDKKLIEFYKSNIKGGDIEFWQFLKIFNKMSRENVNDFDDLEKRNDLHFGVHLLQNEPVNTGSDVTEPVVTEIEPVQTESVSPKNNCKNRKMVSKKFTRAIMISKKEYLRRKEIKDQMRKRIEENNFLGSKCAQLPH